METIFKKNTATFIVDAQKGFSELCPNELPVVGALNIVDECLKTIKKTEYKIGSKDAHNKNSIWISNEKQPQFTQLNYPNADCAWNLHCVPGTLGFEYLDGLPKEEDFDYFVWKGITSTLHPYSAIYHDLQKKMTTGVLEFIKCKNIDTILITGLATNYCVLNTALDLKKAGLNVIVNLGGCAGIGDINPALISMKSIGIRIVNSSEDIISL